MPSALVGVAVGIIAALATATDWPEDPDPWLSGVALVGVFAGPFTWAVVFGRVGQWLGAGDGLVFWTVFAER